MSYMDLSVLKYFMFNLHSNFLKPLYAICLFRLNFQSTFRIKTISAGWVWKLEKVQLLTLPPEGGTTHKWSAYHNKYIFDIPHSINSTFNYMFPKFIYFFFFTKSPPFFLSSSGSWYFILECNLILYIFL